MSKAVWNVVWPRERLQQRAFFTFGQKILLELDLQVHHKTETFAMTSCECSRDAADFMYMQLTHLMLCTCSWLTSVVDP